MFIKCFPINMEYKTLKLIINNSLYVKFTSDNKGPARVMLYCREINIPGSHGSKSKGIWLRGFIVIQHTVCHSQLPTICAMRQRV